MSPSPSGGGPGRGLADRRAALSACGSLVSAARPAGRGLPGGNLLSLWPKKVGKESLPVMLPGDSVAGCPIHGGFERPGAKLAALKHAPSKDPPEPSVNRQHHNGQRRSASPLLLKGPAARGRSARSGIELDSSAIVVSANPDCTHLRRPRESRWHPSSSSLRMPIAPIFVVLAHAGTQWRCSVCAHVPRRWVPAYAGTTKMSVVLHFNGVTPAQAGAQVPRWINGVRPSPG